MQRSDTVPASTSGGVLPSSRIRKLQYALPRPAVPASRPRLARQHAQAASTPALQHNARSHAAAVTLSVPAASPAVPRPSRLPVTCFAAPVSVPATVPSSFPPPVDSPQLRPIRLDVENVADDPSLHNPLQRMQRLGTDWMGVLMEYDGVVVEDTPDLHYQAWAKLAQEEGKPLPLQWLLRKSDGMKNEQVIQELFHWTRAPLQVRRLAARKEELYRQLLGERKPMVPPGVTGLLDTLAKNNVPVALTTSAPEARVTAALRDTGLAASFSAVVAAEDVARGRPDPEAYLWAAQQIGRPPVRCVIVGNSNQSVEAAREAGMKAVVVAGRKPLYELTAADLVVKQLDELSFINLKQLFSEEELVGPQPELEEETEEEGEVEMPRTFTQSYSLF